MAEWWFFGGLIGLVAVMVSLQLWVDWVYWRERSARSRGRRV